MISDYNALITGEQFLFFEIRIVSKLLREGMNREEILNRIREENLFQFPTERKVKRILNACFKRIDSLKSDNLISLLADAPAETAKKVNLYAMMKCYRIVWDFMTTVVAEKYRTQEFEWSRKDLNVFILRLREQNDNVASWSDETILKIKQVLNKALVECGYLNSVKDTRLNLISIEPELEDEIRSLGDYAALPAFNCFG